MESILVYRQMNDRKDPFKFTFFSNKWHGMSIVQNAERYKIGIWR